MKEILGPSSHNGLLEFFNEMVKKGALSKQDLEDYQAGKKVFYTTDLFVRKYIGTTMSGVVDIITENEVEVLTRCSLSKGRIPDEMNVIMSHLDLKYGVSTTAGDATTPEIIDYSNQIYDFADVVADAGASAVSGASVFVKRIPTVFANAEYELKCDDGLVDKGCVNELLHRNSVSYGVGNNAENKKQLYWPKLLPAGKTLRFQLKFPTVGTVPSSSYFFVELRIKGIHLGKRPGA
jgi:hypothetical protein